MTQTYTMHRRLFIGLTGLITVLMFSFSITTAQEAAVEAEPTTVDVFGKSKMQVPADFKKVETKSRILDHEFQATIDGGEAPARVTMMASGGGIDANIRRWQGQFTGGDADAKKTEVMDVGEVKVHVVSNNGSFADSMGGGPFMRGKVVERKDYAMRGAILEYPDGKTYFVKMIGPRKVVKANEPAFMQMLKDLK